MPGHFATMLALRTMLCFRSFTVHSSVGGRCGESRALAQPEGASRGNNNELKTPADLDRSILEEMRQAVSQLRRVWSDVNVPVAAWEGVTVDEKGRVVKIDLQLKGLTGVVPAALGGLTALTCLELANNWPTGVPTELGNLKSLTCSSLFNNQLTSVPAALGNLTALTILELANNQLTGVPAELGNLKSLTSLSLFNNQLTSVPATLGNLTALTSLELANKQLTSVPAALGNLAALTFFELANNQLTSVPAALEDLKAMTYLDLHSNRLTSVPAALGNLTALTYLYLEDNPDLGALPEEVEQLSTAHGDTHCTILK